MKLSVCLIVYNHEPYLRQCLEGIMMQETDFDFEVVVGEDFSTDNSRAILTEYSEKYPGKFKLLFREKNLGRPTLNVYQTSNECSGDYIAYIEGDDYWTDTHKLQKQVAFLDSHPDFTGCTHTCEIVGKNGEEVEDKEALSLYEWDGVYTYTDYQNNPTHWPGQTATVVCRNIFKDAKYDYSILYKAHDFLDDGVILLFLLKQGKIFRMKETMSAWRFVKKDGEGNWNSLKLARNAMAEDCRTKCRLLKWVEENFEISEYGKKLAYADYVTALSLRIKVGGSEMKALEKELFDYNIKHIKLQDKPVNHSLYMIRTIIVEGFNKVFKKK